MIDSHCHLDQEPLFNNLEEVLKRSKEAGLTKLLTICTTFKSFENILNIIKKDEMIYGTFGIHPHETNNDNVYQKDIIRNVNKSNKIIGVGETGLDFYYNNSDKKSQIKSFQEHIKASIELNVPLIVHSRNAEKDTYDILKNFKNDNPKILMHCFTGSKEFAKKLLTLDSTFLQVGLLPLKIQLIFKKHLNFYQLKIY